MQQPDSKKQRSEIIGSMTALINSLELNDGITPTAVPYLSLLKSRQPNLLSQSMLRPSLCLVIQGEKRMMIGQKLIGYQAGCYVLAAIDMLTSGHILKASCKKPYLGLNINFEPTEVADFLITSPLSLPSASQTGPGAYVAEADARLLEVMLRLLRLADQPQDANILALMVKQEIIYRVLTSGHGGLLHSLANGKRNTLGVSRAIALIKKNYSTKLSVDVLSREAGLSVSAFHHKFKSMTTLSPLQYQKQVRLLEARKLLLTEEMDAATAAFQVGYESPSQFNREYRRQFGDSPLKDIARLKKDPIRKPEQNQAIIK